MEKTQSLTLRAAVKERETKMSLIIAIKWNKGKDKDSYKMKCDTKRRESDQKRFLRDRAVS